MSSQPPTQNLAPIMPFIEPIEPIELPSVFDLQASATNQSSSDPTDPPSNTDPSQKNPTAWKGKANATNIKPSDQAADKHHRAASQEEAVIEKTRMELEEKISELNQLKNQVEPYRSFIILDYSRLLLKRKPADVIIKPTLCTDSKRRSLLKPNNANVNWPLESSLDHPRALLAHSKETNKINH